MTTTDHSTKRFRLVLAGAMAIAVGLSVTPGDGQAALEYDPSLSGGTAGVGELTRFEIDGDRVPGVVSNTGITVGPGVNADWESTPYGPQPSTSDPATPAPAGIGSSGLLPLVFSEIKADDYPIVDPSPNPAFGLSGEPEFCSGGKEDGWVGGEKVQKVSIDNPLFNVDGGQALQCASVLDKGNLFSAYAAYETVAVPNQYGNPDAGYQDHAIIYGGWERGEVPGELNFYIPIVDPVPGNSAGDRLIAFDYDSSAPASYRILGWDGANWVVLESGLAASNSTKFAAAVGYADGSPFTPGSGAKPSFGEFALDLTATGILPSDEGPCSELSTAGFVFTETGNSATAQLKDFVGAPRIPINNCGPLSVTKAGPAGITNSPAFDFRIEQQDSERMFETAPTTTPASTLTQYNDQFGLGETVLLDKVVAQPDYMVFEAPVAISGAPPAALPAGWQMVSVDCTYIDGFAAGYPEVTDRLYLDSTGRIEDENGDFKVFQVHSSAFYTLIGRDGYVPNCVITNAAAGIIVAKETLPDGATTPFPFTVGQESIDLADGESAFFPFASGSSVTITEGVPDPAVSPAFVLDDITCLDAGGAEVGAAVGADGVQVVVGNPDNVITCTFTNVQQGQIVIDKQGLPADSTEPFDFTISGPDDIPVSDLTIAGPASAPQSVRPGIHTVTELVPPGDADWRLVDIVCDNEVADSQDLAARTVQVDVGPGDLVSCVFTNHQRGPVSIDKSAVLVDPAPVAGTIDQFDVRYTVTATSESYVDETIVVDDAFDFPTSLSVVSGPVVNGAPASATWNGDGDTVLYSGSIAARGTLEWTIDVRVQLDLAAPPADRDCNAGGSGAWNDVTVAFDGGTDTADACVPFGDPAISVDKTVVGDVTVNPDSSMSVTYQVDVGNTGTGPGAYELSDAFGFPAWVTVTDVVVTPPDGVTANAGFDGDIDEDITTGPVGLGVGATDTYSIAVTFTAAPTATAAGATCVEGPGDGLFNLASITSTSGPADSDACADIPRGRIVVTKATLGGTGTFGFAGVSLFPGNSIATTVADGTPSAPISAYVTPGAYGLTETAPAGWTKIAEPCSEIAVADGQTVSCGFVNGKQGSVTVRKDAAEAGTFEFTFGPGGDVQDIATGGSHTWSGLDAGDYSVTEAVSGTWKLQSAVCDAGTGTASTPYSNGATIPLAWGRDVTCVFTNEVVEADLAIVKTASVAQVGAGGGFDWTLDITNNGPATAVNVVIGDLVPTTLSVTDVTSSDFACGHTGNDVTCTVGSLAVGASGTVTISVRVPQNAVGGSVVNVGTVQSDTPDPDLTNNSDDASVTIVAQSPPLAPPAPPPVTLPPTGSSATFVAVRLAAALMLFGAAALLITRRRRDGRFIVN